MKKVTAAMKVKDLCSFGGKPTIKINESKSESEAHSVVSDSLRPHQAPPSLEFSRQEYSSGLPFPSPGDLPDPGIKPRSPKLQADALTSEPPGKPY